VLLDQAVRQVKVYCFDAKPTQRRFCGLFDILWAKALAPLSHVRADLGDNDHPVPVAPCLHPLANDRLRLAAAVTWRPGRIDIGCVNGIEASFGEAVEHGEGPLLVSGPAEHVSPQHERGDLQASAAKAARYHQELQCSK
jgi:hypothetical protein